MTKDDIELNKLRMLVNAIETVEQEEEVPDFYGILKESAWNILHENPGAEFGDWVTMLIEQYPTEVVDAIGSHPAETYASLTDMWDCDDYRDPDTDMSHTFAEWAEYFATDRSVELYDNLVEARREISRFKARKASKQNPHSSHRSRQKCLSERVEGIPRRNINNQKQGRRWKGNA